MLIYCFVDVWDKEDLWQIDAACVSHFSTFREYLTGFHKRKVERRKAALAEINKKIKDEQIRVREEVSLQLKRC